MIDKNKKYYVIDSARIYFNRVILVTNEMECIQDSDNVYKRIYIDNTFIDVDIKRVEHLEIEVDAKDILSAEGNYNKFVFDNEIVYLSILTALQIEKGEYLLNGTSFDKQHQIYKVLDKTIKALLDREVVNNG